MQRPLKLLDVSRVLGVVAGLTFTVWAILALLDKGDIEHTTMALDTARMLAQRLEITRGFVHEGMSELIVLGDSTVIAYPPGRTVTHRLGAVLTEKLGRKVNALDLAGYGMSSFEYFPFATRVAEMKPDAVVFAFNLQTLSRAWQEKWSRPEMLGWLRMRDLGIAIQEPLHWWGVTLDSLLMYTGIVKLGGDEPWYRYRREQVRAGNGIAALRVGLQRGHSALKAQSNGLPSPPLPYARENSQRFTGAVLQGLYGPALSGVTPDHPILRLLGRVIERLVAADVTVLVYVIPCNSEYLSAVGVMDDAGIGTTLTSIRSVVDSRGGAYIDLHDTLPDRGFRDPGGHFTYDGEFDGPLIVAQRLAGESALVTGLTRVGR